MLAPPNVPNEKIIAYLNAHYNLPVVRLEFLALGADPNTAVYRATTPNDSAYFVKLRQGDFDELSVALPQFLYEQGIRQIIPPLETKTGRLWAKLQRYTVIVYPFVEGKDAYAQALSEQQWIEFGSALQRIHNTKLPPAFHARVQRETFSPEWRERLRNFMQAIQNKTIANPIARRAAEFLTAHRAQVVELIERAEQLGDMLGDQDRNFVLCHTDLHAGNVLLTKEGNLYLVDWDAPLFAPKERDLMFIGARQFVNHRTPQAEEALFYQGYGEIQVNPIALGYYRYERIVQDLAVESTQIFSQKVGAQDRAQEFEYMTRQFAPRGALEMAYASDSTSTRRRFVNAKTYET